MEKPPDWRSENYAKAYEGAFRYLRVECGRRFHQQIRGGCVACYAVLCLHAAVGGVATLALVLEEGMCLRERPWFDS